MPKEETIKLHYLNVPVTDYVVVDLEMTGFSSKHSDIIQVATLKFINDKKVASFNTLVKPERTKISDFVSRLTHITNEDVANSPVIKDVIPELEKFIGDFPIIGHNINCDIKFLIANGFYKPVISSIDTLKMATIKMPFFPNKKLQNLKEYFGVNNVSHNALNDCITTDIVYKHLRDNKLQAVPNLIDDIPHVIAGTRFVLAGNFNITSKTKLTKEIRKYGGTVSSNSSFKTNYLVMENPEIASQFDDPNIANTLELIKHGDKIKIISLENLKNMLLQKPFNNSNEEFVQDFAS